MTLRANYASLAPKAMQTLMDLENYLLQQFDASETVPRKSWELVKLRVSQINQCAYCIDMHSKEALNQGETAQRIIGLSAWREMSMYSETELAALNWAEHLTAGKSVSDEFYHSITETLGEQALVDLTLAISAINSWNRFAKAFRPEVGTYKPQ